MIAHSVEEIHVNSDFLAMNDDFVIGHIIAHEYVHITDMLELGIYYADEWNGTIEHYRSEIKAYRNGLSLYNDFGMNMLPNLEADTQMIECYTLQINQILSDIPSYGC